MIARLEGCWHMKVGHLTPKSCYMRNADRKSYSARAVMQISASGAAKKTAIRSSVCRLQSVMQCPTPLISKVKVKKPSYCYAGADLI